MLKVMQRRDVFIIEFVHVIKLAKAELFRLYTNPYSHFEDSDFDDCQNTHTHIFLIAK
jgi:hypothetical protein